MRLGEWTYAIPAMGVAAVVGLLASGIGVPLAWVLGPMLTVAAVSLAGFKLPDFQGGRKLGQLIVGSAIGLTMTGEAFGMLTAWAPAMMLTAVVSICVTVLLTVPFARLSRLDTATSFFSLTPGGLSEMAGVGAKEGAKTEVIALAQAVRVALLVTLLPSLLLAFGQDGGASASGSLKALSLPVYVGLLLASFGAVYLVRFLRANNPWMIGALLAAGCAAGFGWVEGRAPEVPFALGQYLIGITIGARFRKENMVGMARILMLVVLSIAAMTMLLFGYAVLLHLTSGLDLSSMTLAASPGGMAEMALTAKALHLNVVLITGFHILRSFVVNAYIHQFYRASQRFGVFGFMEKMLDRSR